MKKKILTASVCAAMILSITACGKSEEPINEPAYQPASSAPSVTPTPASSNVIFNNNSSAAPQPESSGSPEYVTNNRFFYQGFFGEYSGGWDNSMPNGYGTFKCTDTNIYFVAEGQWENGELNGEGRKEWLEEIIKGNFKNGELNGKGYKTWIQHGDLSDETFTYDGEFTDGLFVEGKFTYEQKSEKLDYVAVYEGTFDSTENLYTGTYEIYQNNKKKESGVYVKGKKTKS